MTERNKRERIHSYAQSQESCYLPPGNFFYPDRKCRQRNKKVETKEERRKTNQKRERHKLQHEEEEEVEEIPSKLWRFFIWHF